MSDILALVTTADKDIYLTKDMCIHFSSSTGIRLRRYIESTRLLCDDDDEYYDLDHTDVIAWPKIMDILPTLKTIRIRSLIFGKPLFEIRQGEIWSYNAKSDTWSKHIGNKVYVEGNLEYYIALFQKETYKMILESI
jgi:nitrite reductase/ring-hydroxylating ferredoxin subunit